MENRPLFFMVFFFISVVLAFEFDLFYRFGFYQNHDNFCREKIKLNQKKKQVVEVISIPEKLCLQRIVSL